MIDIQKFWFLFWAIKNKSKHPVYKKKTLKLNINVILLTNTIFHLSKTLILYIHITPAEVKRPTTN